MGRVGTRLGRTGALACPARRLAGRIEREQASLIRSRLGDHFSGRSIRWERGGCLVLPSFNCVPTLSTAPFQISNEEIDFTVETLRKML